MDIATTYIETVQWFGRNGADDSILHVHGGMAVLLFTRIMTKRSLASPWPLLAVFVSAFAKEFGDYLAHAMIKPDTLSDILHTVFWPVVLFIGLRVRRAKDVQLSP